MDVQNRSPAAPASAPFSFFSKIVHSQLGYSESSKATGSGLFFKKLSPFNGVPAGIELFTKGWDFCVFNSVASPICRAAPLGFSFFALGVRGSLRGCDVVEVVVGGVGVAVALRRIDVVERKRAVWWDEDCGRRARAAARMQLRQIMMCGCDSRDSVVDVALVCRSKSLDGPDFLFADPRGGAYDCSEARLVSDGINLCF